MRLTIDLPPDLAASATAAARRERRSLPNLIEYALARYIEPDAPPAGGATVAEALDAWLTAPERGERRRNTRRNYDKALAAAMPVLGAQTPIAAVDRATARRTVEHLRVGRRASTANLYVAALNTVWSYAVREGLAGANPFAGLRIKDETGQDERRVKLEDAHLRAVFGSATWRASSGLRRLSLLIQLYTGARSGEVTGLEPGDIGEQDGVPVFRFRDNSRRKLKNRASARVVPVPDALLRLGVMDLDLSSYDHRAAKWTNRLIRSVVKDRRVSQHSARHRFSWSSQNEWDIPLPALNAIGGWTGSREASDISIRVYGGKPTLEQLAKEMAKVRFPVLDALF